MATSFVDIYTRAIAEIDDPFITSTYNTSPISFFKIMNNYLNNAIPLFNTPDAIVTTLADTTEPDGETELFDGNDSDTDFVLTTTPLTGSYYESIVDGGYMTGTFTTATNTMSFSSTPSNGTENVSIEWYYPGQFDTTLTPQEQNILACFLVSCWAEKEKNFLLDIRRLLNDNQFKMDSAANNMKEKGNWYYSMREKAEKLMSQYAWKDYYTTIKARYNI